MNNKKASRAHTTGSRVVRTAACSDTQEKKEAVELLHLNA